MVVSRKDRFKERFQMYYPRLCHIAYSYVADQDDSEDIVQELFITVWNKGKDDLPENEFMLYMTTAVRNSCISFLRRKPSATVSIDDHSLETSSLPDDEHEEQDSHRMRDVLDEVLSLLPPRCKEIFLMSKLRNMKYREIARELDLSEKTVENQMTKAIKLLRTYVAERGFLWLAVISTIISIVLNLG